MPQNRLTIVLLTGGALLLFSGLGAYQWANGPTGPTASPPGAEAPETSSASRRTEDGAGVDTSVLTADNWEVWKDYRGERRRMLGVPKRTETVNFRGGPGTDYPIVDSVEGGTLLFPRDRLNDWFRARLPDGTVGWIHRTLVRELQVPRPVERSLREELPSLARSVKRRIPAAFRNHNRLEVVESRVNLRQGPGTQFGIVGHAYRHQELRLMARRGDWYRIETIHGRNGWVHRNLVEPVWITTPGNRRRIHFSDAGLRIGPRHQFRAPETFSPSESVPVLEEQGEWLLVRVRRDRIGWLHESEVLR